jgi:hypothetical protein
MDNAMSDVEMQEHSPVVNFAPAPQPFQEAIAPALPQQPNQK